MIVLDTSALIALAKDEPGAESCRRVLSSATQVPISAGTLAETLIVAGVQGLRTEVEQILEALPLEIVPVAATDAVLAADAYARWGRGIHPAGTNFGDCFAYALADERSCPLLFTGHDFARTDVRVAVAG